MIISLTPMDFQLKRILKLAKKTGDKVVIYDSNDPDNSFVAMSLDEYEKITSGKDVRNLTEDELLDKINRDIAMWKSDQEYEQNQGLEGNDNPKTSGKKSNPWRIPEEVKSAADEIVDEDTQYLEEIK